MGKKIKITGKPPTKIAAIIESDYKIYRCGFGALSNTRNSFVITSPLVISVGGFLIWLIIYLSIIDPQFRFNSRSSTTKIVQYFNFMLTNNWVYLGLIPIMIGLLKYTADKMLNNIINRITKEKDSI